MDPNVIILFCRYLVIATYGIICLICLVFTLFIKKYKRLSELLQREIIKPRTVTKLESNKINIDRWFFANHIITGLILVLLSLLDGCILYILILRF